MGHYNVMTGSEDFPFVDKVYLTNDHSSYISLNEGVAYYIDGGKERTHRFNMGKNAYKMLACLIEHNGRHVSSFAIYDEVFGFVDGDRIDKVVDEAKKTLWKIDCIKHSDLKIKKHTLSENKDAGYTLLLPNQEDAYIERCKHFAREFYSDDELIERLYYQLNLKSENENVNYRYMYEMLLKDAFHRGDIVELDQLKVVGAASLVSIKSTFILKDIVAEGEHFGVNTNLCEFKKKEVVLFFETYDKNIKVCMAAGGNKLMMGLHHLSYVLLSHNKKFEFIVTGFVDKKGDCDEYSIKPILIEYC